MLEKKFKNGPVITNVFGQYFYSRGGYMFQLVYKLPSDAGMNVYEQIGKVYTKHC